ncbi:MAG: WG repeat-containing protein, partial [Flavobacteriia bacterium]
MRIFNYFKAKDLFESSLKKWESPASYGLTTIYLRKDNPFHSLDSAYLYILRSERTYSLLKEKKKEKLKLLNFDYLNILELRASVSSEFYKRAKDENSIDAYSAFILEHPWANELFEAIAVRDSMAYEQAKQTGSSAAFQSFNDSYPESSLSGIANAEFNRLQYLEMTQSNQLVAYLDFLKKCPSNPYIHQAEDRVYEIVTVENTVESYHSFVQAYPANRNVGPAWRKLYQLFMVDFTDERLEQFKRDFPIYPYWDELEADRSLMKLNLLPFKDENLYGFMDHDGKVIIPAEYEQLGFFKEGLALA